MPGRVMVPRGWFPSTTTLPARRALGAARAFASGLAFRGLRRRWRCQHARDGFWSGAGQVDTSWMHRGRTEAVTSSRGMDRRMESKERTDKERTDVATAGPVAQQQIAAGKEDMTESHNAPGSCGPQWWCPGGGGGTGAEAAVQFTRWPAANGVKRLLHDCGGIHCGALAPMQNGYMVTVHRKQAVKIVP